MTIKQHHNCSEGRHVFIPTRWEEDVKIQQRWVTEFSCQHCLHFVSSDEWRDHLKGKFEFAFEGRPIAPGESINISNETPPIFCSIPGFENIPNIITKDKLDNALGGATYTPIGDDKKKRGRPFAKDKK